MGSLIRRDLKFFTFTPVISTSAYAAADVMGTLLEIPGAVLDGSSSSLVRSVLGLTKGKTGHPSLRLVMFSQKPSGTYTDNGAFDPSNADLALICGIAAFGGTWVDFTTGSSSQSADLNIPITAITSDPNNSGKGGSVWAVLVVVGTPTMQSTSDLTFKVGVEHY